jgi:hypothetical protein
LFSRFLWGPRYFDPAGFCETQRSECIFKECKYQGALYFLKILLSDEEMRAHIHVADLRL